MTRATTVGDGTFGAKVFLSFLTGVGFGVVLIVPVVPDVVQAAFVGLVQASGNVIFVGVAALLIFMVLLFIFFQST